MVTTIGQKIRDGRRRLGFSQEQLSQKLKIDRRRISQIELDRRPPNSEEIRKLVDAGLLDVGSKEGYRAPRRFTSRWVQRPRTCNRPAGRSLAARIAAAKKSFGPRVSELLRRLGDAEQRQQKMDFLANACLDSGSELYLWLDLLADGAMPQWIAPCRAGFRRLPILDPETKDFVSDVRFPCLEFELKGASVIAFPQLTVMARSCIYRLDALLGVMVGQRRVWVNLEIDGDGHVGKFDAERQDRLGLLTVRIATEELVAGRALESLKSKLCELVGL